MSKSEERTDWFGDKYTVHFDDNGKKIGESREEKDWFGDKYTSHTDANGKKVGESREEKGWFGDKYTSHTDANGKKVGESREEKGWFGDKYTRHADADGKKVGESHEEKDWFGDKYTRHSGAVPYVARDVSKSAPASDSAATTDDNSSSSYDDDFSSYSSSDSSSGNTGSGTSSIIGIMVVVAVLLGGFIVLHSDPHATNISRPTLPQTTKPTSIAPSWSQPGEVESKLLERAHAEIDHVYKTVMDTLIPAQQESLRQEEREWISWRDAEADRIARRTSVGGSAYRVDRLNAMIDLVKKSGRSICAAIVPSQPFERRNWAISNHLLELPFERRFWTQSELPQRAIWDSLWCFR